MNFKAASSKVNFPELEKKILAYWQKEKIFEKSLKNRQKAKKFSFYDGPPFATGLPHYGHILAMTIKDAITRLKTMEGFYVPRRLGWDTHGLPVEYELEKELGISGKKDIEKMGIDKFNDGCRNIVFRYTKEWQKTIDRMGRWADKKNTYATLDTDYMESIWWVFKQLWDKDLIYKGFKSMPYCPRCATPLSNFETNQGYKDDIEDPSIYIKFQSKDDPKTFFLAWTTTPWTLPGNAALAINPKTDYVKVKVASEFLILAEKRLDVLDVYENPQKLKAKDLIGKIYLPLFDFFQKDKNQKSSSTYLPQAQDKSKDAYRILSADFVSTEEGTGIVHIAPAFGEDDLNLGLKEDLPLIQPVDKNGQFTIEPYKGIFVKKADKMIIEHLDESGNLYKAETIKHTYPFCWRCETPLLYYATANWFVKVSSFKDLLVKNNKEIHWTPSHIKEGRFGKWLAEARDWSISRNRFWGTPLPIWQCQKCQKYQVIGSVGELREKSVNFNELEKASKILFDLGKQKSTSFLVDLHRPHIDNVVIKCECGGQAKRIEEVLDCWFESGSMPYAEDHYPFENRKLWEENFPADFIAEGLDQTRGWFYTLHVLATALFDKPAFKNIIVNGIVVDPEGKKLSKRLRNYPEPDEVFDKFGADAMRFYLLTSQAALADDVRFSAKAIEETVRKFFLILWNVYVFFVTYANIDDWQPSKKSTVFTRPTNVLDLWILSKLSGLISDIDKGDKNYNLPKMTRPMQEFIDNLSTWYVRRSRDRIGPTAQNGPDKNSCYQTLYFVLVTFCKLLAPFAPFVSEEIYLNLTGEDSVHLADWPKAENRYLSQKLEGNMKLARQIVESIHAKRKNVGIKVRQPLSKVIYSEQKLPQEIEKIIAKEVNVKKVIFKDDSDIEIDVKLDKKLREEGHAREIIRQIQQVRKETGCSLDERISIKLPTWPKEFENYIKKETLADKLEKSDKVKIVRSKS